MNARHRGKRKGCETSDPSPNDIRRACKDIQLSWSKRERQKRAGRVPDGPWMPPNVSWSTIAEAADDLGESSSSPYGALLSSDRG